jgi:hypothetical protein
MESHLMKLRLCFHLDKCAFMVFLGLNLGLIISKEGKIPNPKKGSSNNEYASTYKPIVDSIFDGMAQFCRCFIKNFAIIMARITKLMRKIKPFIQTIECQKI